MKLPHLLFDVPTNWLCLQGIKDGYKLSIQGHRTVSALRIWPFWIPFCPLNAEHN